MMHWILGEQTYARFSGSYFWVGMYRIPLLMISCRALQLLGILDRSMDENFSFAFEGKYKDLECLGWHPKYVYWEVKPHWTKWGILLVNMHRSLLESCNPVHMLNPVEFNSEDKSYRFGLHDTKWLQNALIVLMYNNVADVQCRFEAGVQLDNKQMNQKRALEAQGKSWRQALLS